MLDSNHTHYQSAFAQFDSQLKEICETDLVQKLRDPDIVESSQNATCLFSALNRLRDVVYDIRSNYGSQGPNRNWNPPISKPPTPSLKRRISALESEVIELRDTAEKRDMELEQASVRLDEYRDEISKANTNIENLGCQLASEYGTHKKFDQAAEQYDFLSRLKDKELKEKRSINDSVRADAAKRVWLRYSHQKGKMLLRASRFPEAEQTMRQVLEKGKEIHKDAKLKRQENRDAQLDLCTALRSQGVASKYKEAEDLYHPESRLTHLSTQNEADRTWAIRNDFEFAYVNAEQALYPSMVGHLEDVWPSRGRASSECRQYLETAIVQLWQLLQQRKEVSYTTRVLEIYCKGSNGLQSKFLDLITEQGKALQKRGEHKDAIYFLRLAWEAPSAPSSERRSLGLSLAWSLCHLKHFSESSKILENLLNQSNSNTSPSEPELRAMLAHNQLQLGNLKEAERNARIVLNQCGTSVLPGFQSFNHANILIRTLIRHDQREKYHEAHAVWQSIYKDRKQIAKKQLKDHAQVGNELADIWESSAKRRGNRAGKAQEVKTQAKELGGMAG